MPRKSYKLKKCCRCGKEEIIYAYRDDHDTVTAAYAVCPDNHSIRVFKTSVAALAAMG